MISKLITIGLGMVVALGAAAFGIFAVAGTSSASATTTPTATSAASTATAPSLLAVAIGELQGTGGAYATVDLRATVKNGTTGGTLRFYAEGDGYYNGGVKSFTCLNGQITVKGGGGFVKPDGTRIAVVYEAHFDKTTGQATITVKAKNGFQYTLTGNLNGLTWCGNPTQAPPNVS
ncbi:MAG TPA: hypothetical protein VIP09_05180 [Dehalococcoidia bacterium]|jgi:hypothetical protein